MKPQNEKLFWMEGILSVQHYHSLLCSFCHRNFHFLYEFRLNYHIGALIESIQAPDLRFPSIIPRLLVQWSYPTQQVKYGVSPRSSFQWHQSEEDKARASELFNFEREIRKAASLPRDLDLVLLFYPNLHSSPPHGILDYIGDSIRLRFWRKWKTWVQSLNWIKVGVLEISALLFDP